MRWASSVRGNLIAIVLALAIGGILAFLSVRYVDLGRVSNYGFGPDWQCTRVGKGDPICVRRR